MIKHPALRIRSIEDCDPAFLNGLQGDLEAFGFMTPFSDLIIDWEIVGSYARNCANLGSDLDINAATGSNFLKAKELIRTNENQFRDALEFLRSVTMKYGIQMQAHLEHPSVRELGLKRCFSIRERKMYGTEMRRVSIDEKTGEAIPRNINPKLEPPHLSIGVLDEFGNTREFRPGRDSFEAFDPWYAEIDDWKKKYGSKFLEFGKTDETAWMV